MTTLVVEETESEKKFSQEVKSILEFVNVLPKEIPNGLPPMRDIQHQIGLIPGLVFRNKQASIMSPNKHEELKHKLMICLTKGLFKNVKVLMWFLLCWCMKKMDLREYVLIAKLSITFLFMGK